MSRKAEDGVDEDVRVAFLGLRNQQTACPPVERLVDFHDGRLTAEAHRVVADHVILCGTCDFLIERIKSSEEAARVEAAAIPPAEWRSIDRRLTRSFESALSGRIDSRRGVPGRVALFWHPAVAYALTVILAYPAYLGIVSKLRVAPPIERKESTPAAESSAAVQLARSFDLSRTRGAG